MEKRYDAEQLKIFASSVIQKAGLGKKNSDLFADSLVNADMRKVHSHGLTRLSTYVRRIQEKLVSADATPTLLEDGGSLLLVDANNGMGVPAAYMAMEWCMERAAKTGVCFAAVRGGNHFGYAAYFTEYAARHDMIGIAMSNGPAAMAPIGGKEAVLGTNPLSVSVPAERHLPLVLDMATSVVARGKVTLAKKEGRSIPEGWGIDKEGRSTTDPSQVSTVLPFGGAKGYAISLIIELLCSCLSGAKTGQTMGSFYDFSGCHQDAGFFLGAIDPSVILPVDLLKSRVDELMDSIKLAPRAAGCQEIFIPGEIEFRNAAKAEAEGITLGPAVLAELNTLAEQYQIPFDCALK